MDSTPGADDDRHLFAGVRFVLVGFDSVSESQDDPVCVAARAQGNKVVNELWVDDSLDRAALADADRVFYWPTRDLNDIPGSESLQICLTGYQRNDREDIMKMVSLMGAQFSKRLVGGVVTHLVCYKFEGEKYELAKRLSIKLVNHRWLEDCLKSWEILPVDDYKKSSWELEMMEVQVKDSGDEVEDVDRKPFNSRSSIKRTPKPQNGIGTSGNPDVDAPIRPPIIPNDDQNMAVELHLNTPTSQIRKEENMVKKTHDTTAQLQGTPNFSRLASSTNTDRAAPIQTPFVISGNREEAAVRNMNSPNQIQVAEYDYVNTSGQIRKEEEMVKKTHDITAQGTPDLSRFASSTNTDSGAPLQPPFVISGNREEGAVRNLNSPNQVQAAEYKYVGSDIATGALGTPNSSRMAVPANHHIHSSDETLTVPKNKATPRARNAGAKRLRSTSMEVDGSVVNNGKAVVSESETDKMFRGQLATATSEKDSSSASATEQKTSPKKVPVGGVRSALAKRQQSAHIKVNDVQVEFELELNKVISRENVETVPKRFCSSAHDDEHGRKLPKKLPNTRVKNTAVKKARKSDINMTIESPADKVAAESLFDDLFPSDNVSDCPKKLSSSASVDGCGTISSKNMSKAKVRKAVAKRKIKAVEDKSGSKHDKIGSAIVSAAKAFSSKRMESACNTDKVTADQDPPEGQQWW